LPHSSIYSAAAQESGDATIRFKKKDWAIVDMSSIDTFAVKL